MRDCINSEATELRLDRMRCCDAVYIQGVGVLPGPGCPGDSVNDSLVAHQLP